MKLIRLQSEEEKEFLSAIIKMTNEVHEEHLVAAANEVRRVRLFRL
jgi:hypothetical protein